MKDSTRAKLIERHGKESLRCITRCVAVHHPGTPRHLASSWTEMHKRLLTIDLLQRRYSLVRAVHFVAALSMIGLAHSLQGSSAEAETYLWKDMQRNLQLKKPARGVIW